MKYVVAADSHNRKDMLEKLRIVIESMDGVAAVIHLGDLEGDARWLGEHLSVPVYGVPGNCDMRFDDPDETVMTLDGVRTLVCHGHRHWVKRTLEPLSYRAEELGAKLALYGHTHLKCMQNTGGVLMVNPGALADGLYAVLDLSRGGVVSVRFMDLARNG